MDQPIAKSLHHDWRENSDGTVTVTTSQDVGKYLRNAADLRSADQESVNRATEGAGLHLVGTIPPVIVQLWRDEGFDLLSPERSNMTKEQHQQEILRRLCGEYSLLNTSRFARLA